MKKNKTLTPQELEKVHEILLKIESLDRNLKKIERFADILINSDSGVNLQLKILEPVEAEEDGSRSVSVISHPDDFADMMKGIKMKMFEMGFGGNLTQNKIEKQSRLEVEIKEGEALVILQTILNVRTSERFALKEELKQYSIYIS